MGQRISRAKRTIATASARFELPAGDELSARVEAVLQVLYLIFNEGYVASSGPDLMRRERTREAIRLRASCARCCPAAGRPGSR